MKRRRFCESQDFCRKFDPLNSFLYGEVHTILRLKFDSIRFFFIILNKNKRTLKIRFCYLY